jgi:hypothetical protein
MRFRRNVGVGYGAFWRGVIFDREYKNLDDLVNKSRRWFNSIRRRGALPKFGAGLQMDLADWRGIAISCDQKA